MSTFLQQGIPAINRRINEAHGNIPSLYPAIYHGRINESSVLITPSTRLNIDTFRQGPSTINRRINEAHGNIPSLYPAISEPSGVTPSTPSTPNP